MELASRNRSPKKAGGGEGIPSGIQYRARKRDCGIVFLSMFFIFFSEVAGVALSSAGCAANLVPKFTMPNLSMPKYGHDNFSAKT
jgi:hypothetical protein